MRRLKFTSLPILMALLVTLFSSIPDLSPAVAQSGKVTKLQQLDEVGGYYDSEIARQRRVIADMKKVIEDSKRQGGVAPDTNRLKAQGRVGQGVVGAGKSKPKHIQREIEKFEKIFKWSNVRDAAKLAGYTVIEVVKYKIRRSRELGIKIDYLSKKDMDAIRKMGGGRASYQIEIERSEAYVAQLESEKRNNNRERKALISGMSKDEREEYRRQQTAASDAKKRAAAAQAQREQDKIDEQAQQKLRDEAKKRRQDAADAWYDNLEREREAKEKAQRDAEKAAADKKAAAVKAAADKKAADEQDKLARDNAAADKKAADKQAQLDRDNAANEQQQAEDAQSALNACQFKKSRGMISNLPKGSNRSALSAQWNKAYKVERRARSLKNNAIALAKKKQFKAALAGLHQALGVPPFCQETVAKTNRAINKIEGLIGKAENKNIQAVINACQFKKSRGMIGNLPKGPSRSALSAQWNKAYNAERQARRLKNNALALAREKSFKPALAGLHQALGVPPFCQQTVASINRAISKINNRKIAGPQSCPKYQKWHKFLGKCASAYDFNMYCKRKYPGSVPSSNSKSLCVCPSGTRPSKKFAGCVRNRKPPQKQLTRKRICPKWSKRKQLMIDTNGILRDGTHIICEYCRPGNELSTQWHFKNGKVLYADKFKWPCKKKVRTRKPGNFKKLKNFGNALRRGAY